MRLKIVQNINDLSRPPFEIHDGDRYVAGVYSYKHARLFAASFDLLKGLSQAADDLDGSPYWDIGERNMGTKELLGQLKRALDDKP